MLEQKINKEQYAALHEVLQSEYKQDGDDYTIQVGGMKTQSDIDAIKSAKDQAKREQKEAQGRVKELEREKNTLSDKVAAYESDEDKKLDSEQLVEFQRLKRVEETLATEKAELQDKYLGLETQVTTNAIKAALNKSGKGIIRDDALDYEVGRLADKFVISDKKVLTNTDLGDDSGLKAEDFLTRHVERHPHLKPTSSGGGAGGDKGPGGGSHQDKPTGQVTASQDAWQGR